MKVRVLKPFRDKQTGSVLRPDLIIYLAEERVEELTSTLDPFVEVEEKTIEVDEGNLVLPDFKAMNKDNIVKFAKDVMNIELDNSLTKAEMIKLLEE